MVLTERGTKCVCADRKKDKKEAENYRTRQKIRTKTKNNTDISFLRRGQLKEQGVIAIHICQNFEHFFSKGES